MAGNPLQVKAHGYSKVLLALVGVSPAVLTETVWALAAEGPPLIPDYVVALTTPPGLNRIESVLFRQGGWNRLCKALEKRQFSLKSSLRFGLAADHIRLFPTPDGNGNLADIVTAEDSAAAADFIMRCLRQFTEDSDTQVIASIAGGRKTMSSLLTSCMILLGRKQDRLCHVLVSPPFDSPVLKPVFLFPERRRMHSLPGGTRALRSAAARLELTDIPFVRVRGWYEKEYGRTPPSYMSMVRRIQGLAPEATYCPQITVDMRRGTVLVDTSEVRLSSAEFALFAVLARRAANDLPLRRWSDIEGEIDEIRKRVKVPANASWLHDFIERRFDMKEDARKLATSIRKKIGRCITDGTLAYRIIPSLKLQQREPYPGARISIKGFDDVI